MKCPTGDGELISHSTHGESNLTVTYSTCPFCRGHWMESFAANFIKLTPEELQKKHAGAHPDASYSCPICRKGLERATGDNIPDTVTVYSCPEGHGYFFPAGQLAAWKNAQSAKIVYHKLWNIPLPNVGSVLLTGFLTAILTGGLVIGLSVVQNRQTTSSQAKQFLAWQRAYAVPNTHILLVSAQTQEKTTLTIHIVTPYTIEKPLDTKDGLTHIIEVTDVPSGSYQYYFSWEQGANLVRSETYSVVIP